MKTTIPIMLFLMAFLGACDTIEQDDFMQGGNSGGVDSTTIIKKVLIEDFTGFRCKNCPEAATELHAIEGLYEGKIVGIGIHVGYFAASAVVLPLTLERMLAKNLMRFLVPPFWITHRLGQPNWLPQRAKPTHRLG